ncbi:hypothetical protein ACHAW5_002766 [Stephanodiscus triporus]|uniref:Ubiquitin-like domain-containing protein n=1 Tax=Stephanodiscus triporus TaxID=2934178 RepID=A0ABD3NH49_9STRA
MMATTNSNRGKAETRPNAAKHGRTIVSPRRGDGPSGLLNDKENASPAAANAGGGDTSSPPRPPPRAVAAVVKGAAARAKKVRRERDADEMREEDWWKAHVAEAATLIESCAGGSLSWDVVDARRVFASYRQFLLLKKERADWDGTRLVPCWPVNEMWRAHGRMVDYDRDMNDLLGHAVEIRARAVVAVSDDAPTTVLPAEVRQVPAAQEEGVDPARLRSREQVRLERTTREALKRRFGSHHDDELWAVVPVCIVDQLGAETTFEVNRREPLFDALDEYARTVKGESLEKYQFEYAGKVIPLEKRSDILAGTPIGLGFGRHAKIEASHVDTAAFTVRYSPEKQRVFLVEKTSMIAEAFEEFAREVMDTQRSNLVFVLGDERVYGHESSVALGLKCRANDVIRVVDAGSYKCKNCICCNPRLADVPKKSTGNEGVQDDDSFDDESVALLR